MIAVSPRDRYTPYISYDVSDSRRRIKRINVWILSLIPTAYNIRHRHVNLAVLWRLINRLFYRDNDGEFAEESSVTTVPSTGRLNAGRIRCHLRWHSGIQRIRL